MMNHGIALENEAMLGVNRAVADTYFCLFAAERNFSDASET
jgi:hypothetical protein